VQRLVAESHAGLGPKKSPPPVDRFDRAAARKTIALDRPSVFLLLRGSILVVVEDATRRDSSIFCVTSLAFRGEFWQGRRLGQQCCPNGFLGGMAGQGSCS
jgi:hypothetical protein